MGTEPSRVVLLLFSSSSSALLLLLSPTVVLFGRLGSFSNCFGGKVGVIVTVLPAVVTIEERRGDSDLEGGTNLQEFLLEDVTGQVVRSTGFSLAFDDIVDFEQNDATSFVADRTAVEGNETNLSLRL